MESSHASIGLQIGHVSILVESRGPRRALALAMICRFGLRWRSVPDDPEETSVVEPVGLLKRCEFYCLDASARPSRAISYSPNDRLGQCQRKFKSSGRNRLWLHDFSLEHDHSANYRTGIAFNDPLGPVRVQRFEILPLSLHDQLLECRLVGILPPDDDEPPVIG